MAWRIIGGDAREVLRTVPAASVQCVVTSPPYFGLRDYKAEGQIGLEPTPAAYVQALVEVFREVRRVLRDDGTVFLNLGDSYATGTTANKNPTTTTGPAVPASWAGRCQPERCGTPLGLKTKDLIGIPWRAAFALQADGWYLRSDIIWAKPNPMPESVTDRPTRAHEYVFLLSKRAKYHYDAEAIREPPSEAMLAQVRAGYHGHATKDYAAAGVQDPSAVKARIIARKRAQLLGANCRSVWTIATQPYPGAHFATFPDALPDRCIRAGSREGDTVLDPFCGAGTTGLVADRLGRDFIGIELNGGYRALARRRITDDAPLLTRELPGVAEEATGGD